MKIKTKNAKNGFTSTVNLALHRDFNIEDTKDRSQIRVMEVKKNRYGETIRRQQHFIFKIKSPIHVFTDLY